METIVAILGILGKLKKEHIFAKVSMLNAKSLYKTLDNFISYSCDENVYEFILSLSECFGQLVDSFCRSDILKIKSIGFSFRS